MMDSLYDFCWFAARAGLLWLWATVGVLLLFSLIPPRKSA